MRPEHVLLALALGVPLAFNPFGTLAFEPFKAALVRLGALLLIFSYAAHLGRGRLSGMAPLASSGARPLVLASLAYLVASAVSTVASVQPGLSALGSYDRAQGLLTELAFAVVAIAVADGRQRPERLVDWLLVGSVPVCLYALAQHFRLDPLIWLDRTLGPASTVGSSTSLGGYLAMLVPLTIARAVEARRELARQPGGPAFRYGSLVVLFCLQTSVVFASSVRGALLGLLAGLGMLAAASLWRRQGLRGRLAGGLGAVMAACALGLVISLAPWDDLAMLSPGLDRWAEIGPADSSGRERLLVWGAAVQVWASGGSRILLGTGPETQSIALERDFPVALASRWPDLRFDRAHNWLLDRLLTAGVLGVVTQVWLFAAAGLNAQRSTLNAQRWLGAGLLGSLAAHVVESALAFGSITTLFLFWLEIGLIARLGATVSGAERGGDDQPARRPGAPLTTRAIAVGLVVLVLVLVPVIMSPLAADLAYTRSLAHHGARDIAGEMDWARRATILAPWTDLYHLALGLALADAASEEPREERRGAQLGEAQRAIGRAVELSPLEPYNHYHLGALLELRAEAERSEAVRSLAAENYARAAAVSPNRPVFHDAAALAAHRMGQSELALAGYRRADSLDGPNAERMARIGDCWLALGDEAQAAESYQRALQLAPRSAPAHAGLGELRYRQGDRLEAAEQLRLATRYQLREWRYHERLAELERELGRIEEAVLEYRAAARFAPPWEQGRLRALLAELRAPG